MKPLLTAAEVRKAEATAVAQGTSTRELMERAGRALAASALRHAGAGARFFVLSGPGNNGGDGLVAARVLRAADREVAVALLADPDKLPPEARASHQALEEAGMSTRPSLEGMEPSPGDWAVDALLGTGLNRPPAGALAAAIQRLGSWRDRGVRVLAADLPSGLASDTGQPFEPHVRADATVAFGAMKVGLAFEPGASLAGPVEVVEIGMPEVAAPTQLLTEDDVRGWLPVRRAESHKGTYGHLLVVAGSHGKSGAAALSGLAALRSGVGLCTVATPDDALSDVLGHGPELMGIPLPAGALGERHLEALRSAAAGKDAVVIGPGILHGQETHALLGALLEALEVPVLLDADALNALAGHLEVLGRARAPVVLTPHPGEMARLAGVSTAEVQRDRLGLARRFAEEHRVTLVLKGARTLVALADGSVRVNPTGNPGMATGGTGDVLSGVCGALLAQGLSAADAASAAVYAHGLAGDLQSERTGQMGLVASDLLAGLGRVWRHWNL